MSLDGKKVAFLVAPEGVEQVELTEPWAAVEKAGGQPVLVVGGDEKTVQAFNHLDKGDTFDVDATVDDAAPGDFDALVLPGGVANPDLLRMHPGAVAFVKDAPIAAEWEGRPEGPIAEAQYAEKMLEASPDTPLAPFIHVFAAQRYRAAAEAAEHAADAQAAADAELRYREHLRQARAAKDPIFGLIADDLERVPYVYVQRSR